MFQPGVQNWKLRKTNGGGRPPKEITDGIFALGKKCLVFMDEIMCGENKKLKVEVTKIIMTKLAPDLTAKVGSEWITKYDERAEQFISRRIRGVEGLQVITSGKQANGTTGSV